ncbi:MAG: RusA family crossover junction endodeoxyribonuclease [Butyrivibrio sp.]|nr:RusA family crossover junction endodeoxyribonuclease [Butyrivibrio sp.]
MKHEQVIPGQPPSKANSYRVITFNGHSSLGKTSAMKSYEKKFYLMCGAYRNMRIGGFFELYVDVYFQSNLPDLDNALKVILDCLQGCDAIKNDRQCVRIVANKYIDKVNPRIEFTLREVGGVEQRDSREPGLFD